jgi:hypothetical protein
MHSRLTLKQKYKENKFTVAYGLRPALSSGLLSFLAPLSWQEYREEKWKTEGSGRRDQL